jgi:hypothetical protein
MQFAWPRQLTARPSSWFLWGSWILIRVYVREVILICNVLCNKTKPLMYYAIQILCMVHIHTQCMSIAPS